MAPSVRLSLRAIRAAGVFAFANCLSSRTSSAVHSRRFGFLTNNVPPKWCARARHAPAEVSGNRHLPIESRSKSQADSDQAARSTRSDERQAVFAAADRLVGVLGSDRAGSATPQRAIECLRRKIDMRSLTAARSRRHAAAAGPASRAHDRPAA